MLYVGAARLHALLVAACARTEPAVNAQLAHNVHFSLLDARAEISVLRPNREEMLITEYASLHATPFF